MCVGDTRKMEQDGDRQSERYVRVTEEEENLRRKTLTENELSPSS